MQPRRDEMFRTKLKMVQQICAVSSLLLVTGIANAGNWQSPWASEKGAAAARCAKTFDDYQLQAICMNNEKDGYDKMQDNFGLPISESQKAKTRCARTFADFQLQEICMNNEKDGYDKMQKY
jgi:hypothetical protein